MIAALFCSDQFFLWNLKPTRGFYRPDDDCPEYGASAYLDRESPICPDLLKSTHHLLVQNLLISAQVAARNTAGLLMVLAINLRLLFLRPTDGRTGSDTAPPPPEYIPFPISVLSLTFCKCHPYSQICTSTHRALFRRGL